MTKPECTHRSSSDPIVDGECPAVAGTLKTGAIAPIAFVHVCAWGANVKIFGAMTTKLEMAQDWPRPGRTRRPYRGLTQPFHCFWDGLEGTVVRRTDCRDGHTLSSS